MEHMRRHKGMSRRDFARSIAWGGSATLLLATPALAPLSLDHLLATRDRHKPQPAILHLLQSRNGCTIGRKDCVWRRAWKLVNERKK
jgi:hypothetical protein